MSRRRGAQARIRRWRGIDLDGSIVQMSEAKVFMEARRLRKGAQLDLGAVKLHGLRIARSRNAALLAGWEDVARLHPIRQRVLVPVAPRETAVSAVGGAAVKRLERRGLAVAEAKAVAALDQIAQLAALIVERLGDLDTPAGQEVAKISILLDEQGITPPREGPC